MVGNALAELQAYKLSDTVKAEALFGALTERLGEVEAYTLSPAVANEKAKPLVDNVAHMLS